MNTIRQIQALNKREIEAGVTPSASWHADYRHTAYVYIGGLPYDLSEGDIVTIFSQFGEPVYINLVRDKETGKSKGFAFLKYEDQRSTDLAVDNLGGSSLMGRMLRVDHARYKRKDDEEMVDNTDGADTQRIEAGAKDESQQRRQNSESDVERPMLPEESELVELIQNHDDDDPMKVYLVKQKQEEVAIAVRKFESKQRKEHKDRRRHRHSHKNGQRRRDRSRTQSPSHSSGGEHKRHHRASRKSPDRSNRRQSRNERTVNNPRSQPKSP